LRGEFGHSTKKNIGYTPGPLETFIRSSNKPSSILHAENNLKPSQISTVNIKTKHSILHVVFLTCQY